MVKPQSDLHVALLEAKIPAIAHFVKALRQALSDAPVLGTYLEGRLKHGLLLNLEAQIVGDGTAPASMKGLTAPGNFTPFIAGPAGTTTIDGVRGAIGQLNDLSFSADAMILNPGEFTDMELIKDEQGRYIIGNPNCGSSVVLNVMVKHSTSGRFQARSRTQALSINPL